MRAVREEGEINLPLFIAAWHDFKGCRPVSTAG